MIIDKDIHINVQTTENSRLESIDKENLNFGKVFSDHMFIADYKNGAWTDFRILPYGKLSFTPALITLHYAQTIFEGMKAYKTEQGGINLFRPLKNWERMNKSAERLCMPAIPESVFINGISELVKLDKDWVPSKKGQSLYLRPFMFATDEFIGVRNADTYSFIVITSPVGAYYPDPVKVKIETQYTRAVEGGIGYAKTGGNYAASLYPAKLAKEQGFDQVIWTDGKTHEYIEEAGTMNLMFKVKGKLITATLGDSVLNGVTRNSVINLAKDWGITVEERKISVKELVQYAEDGILEEAFGVGTAATVAPIAMIAHEDKRFDLPPFGEGCFSYKVKQYLTDLCAGVNEDKFDWIHQVI